jgi:uncharacterized protein YacL (UPF0231 family)
MEDKKDKIVVRCTVEHEVVTDDAVLREEQEQTIEKIEKSKNSKLSHKRSIEVDGITQEYTVKKVVKDGQAGEKTVETSMNEEELKKFQEQWNNLWNPMLDSDEDD